MQIDKLSKNSEFTNLQYIVQIIISIANLCKIQNLAVCIIMQSAKIGRILIKILVKLQIWEGMGCRAFEMG